MTTCPRCEGRKGGPAFLGGPTGSHFDPFFPCDMCKGKGEVLDHVAKWFAVGRVHYRERLARGESLRECARRLGFGLAELSSMEHGRADPAPLTEERS